MWELPRPPIGRGPGGRVDWARPFEKKEKYIFDHFLKEMGYSKKPPNHDDYISMYITVRGRGGEKSFIHRKK